MNFRIFLLAVLLVTSGTSYAEGGSCPAGYYPVGGQGAGGCAPIPGYSSPGDSGKIENAARWLKTWGAIASDDELAVLGVATGYRTEQSAKEAAIESCLERGGGAGCASIAVTYENQCVVVATGSKGQSYTTAESIKVATEGSMKRCLAKEAINCRVYYSACSEPIRIQ